jgi:uncharacterized protein
MFWRSKASHARNLFAAVESNDAAGVGRLAQRTAILEWRNDSGWTCLAEAVLDGSADVVGILLKAGSDPNAQLPAKLERSERDVADELHRRGLPDTAIVRAGSWTPLLEAVSNGHQAIVRQLIDAGADINATSLGKVDPGAFVRDGMLRNVGSQAGVNPYRKDGWTALFEAVEKGHEEIVELLLDRGANLRATTKGGDTPLMRAALEGHTRVVERLLRGGADVHASNSDGWTALFCASGRGHLGIIAALLAAGADVNRKNNSNATTLMWAANVHTIRALLAAGARVNEVSNKGGTALFAAVGKRDVEAVAALLQAGARVDVTANDGTSLLQLAHQSFNAHIVSLIDDAHSRGAT